MAPIVSDEEINVQKPQTAFKVIPKTSADQVSDSVNAAADAISGKSFEKGTGK